MSGGECMLVNDSSAEPMCSFVSILLHAGSMEVHSIQGSCVVFQKDLDVAPKVMISRLISFLGGPSRQVSTHKCY